MRSEHEPASVSVHRVRSAREPVQNRRSVSIGNRSVEPRSPRGQGQIHGSTLTSESQSAKPRPDSSDVEVRRSRLKSASPARGQRVKSAVARQPQQQQHHQQQRSSTEVQSKFFRAEQDSLDFDGKSFTTSTRPVLRGHSSYSRTRPKSSNYPGGDPTWSRSSSAAYCYPYHNSLVSSDSKWMHKIRMEDDYYLYSLAKVYDISDLRRKKEIQYWNLLMRQQNLGFHSRGECEGYFRYLSRPRQTEFGTSYPGVSRIASADVRSRRSRRRRSNGTDSRGRSASTTDGERTASAWRSRDDYAPVSRKTEPRIRAEEGSEERKRNLEEKRKNKTKNNKGQAVVREKSNDGKDKLIRRQKSGVDEKTDELGKGKLLGVILTDAGEPQETKKKESENSNEGVTSSPRLSDEISNKPHKQPSVSPAKSDSKSSGEKKSNNSGSTTASSDASDDDDDNHGEKAIKEEK